MDRAPCTMRASVPGDGAAVLQIWRDAVDATHDFLSATDRKAIDAEVADFLPSAPFWLDGQGRPYPIIHLRHMP